MSLVESQDPYGVLARAKPKNSRRDKELNNLTARQRGLIEALVFGEGDKSVELPQICEKFNVQRRYVRDLLAAEIGQDHYRKMLELKRKLAAPEAMDTVIKTMRTEGEGAAADRRLQLDASCKILGDFAPKAAAVEVKNEGSTFIQIVQRALAYDGPVEPPAYLGEIDTPEKFRARQRGDSD